VSKRIEINDLSCYYGKFRAVEGVSLSVEPRSVTAFIGPSGCGKSTVLRSLNRMHEVIPGAYVTGEVLLDGENLYAPDVDPVRVRRQVGMVFQRPNPFPAMSIFENVVSGLRFNGVHGKALLRDAAETALHHAALWDVVKDRLHQPAVKLSGGQQQRLCIARALAVEPEILLMDEPCSALDPIATAKIEDLILHLASDVTIVLVTHNMFEARRVATRTAVFLLGDDRVGELVEVGPTAEVFESPRDERTRAYVTGQVG
jgi:phosphate transport system ATP-binding protein